MRKDNRQPNSRRPLSSSEIRASRSAKCTGANHVADPSVWRLAGAGHDRRLQDDDGWLWRALAAPSPAKSPWWCVVCGVLAASARRAALCPPPRKYTVHSVSPYGARAVDLLIGAGDLSMKVINQPRVGAELQVRGG